MTASDLASPARIAAAEAKLGGKIATDLTQLLKQAVIAAGNITGGGGGGGLESVTLVGEDGITVVESGTPTNPIYTIGNSGGGGGVSFIKADASEFIPNTTNGCGVNSTETIGEALNNRDYLVFDPATKQYATFWFNWPSGWTGCKITFFWNGDDGVSPRSVVWGASGRVWTQGDPTNSGPGTEVVIAQAGVDNGAFYQSDPTPAMTPAGTITAGKRAQLIIFRDADNAGDTYASPANLEGVLIENAT